jgi:DNA modification methylase
MQPYKVTPSGVIYNVDAIELMNSIDKEVDLHIIDIPYSISVEGGDIQFSNRADMIRNFGEWDKINFTFDDLSSALSKSAKNDANVIIFFNNWYLYSDLVKALDKHFDGVFSLVWEKSNPRPQVRKRHFVMSHELIVWASRGKYTLNFLGHNEMRSFCNGSVPRRWRDENKEVIHNTQKPLWIHKHYIEILSNENDLVMDAFCGVGTTAIACKELNRRFTVNDVEKKYLDAFIPKLS